MHQPTFRCGAPVTPRSYGNRAVARDCAGQGYGSGVAGFDAVRLWHEYERGSDAALELLLKCSRADVVDLETIIELAHPGFVAAVFSAAGGAR